MIKPERMHQYVSPIADSARWAQIAPRAGDIIVATPYKTGTTWTQTLCALLVHGAPPFPQPLSALSPWVDLKKEPIDSVSARCAAQTHRRILKTHTPLDGLDYREDASYVVCGRDPRDALLSMMDHFENFAPEMVAGDGRAPRTLPENPNDLFPIWMNVPAHPWLKDGAPFGPFFHHIESFWAFRTLPNIMFLHYEDMSDDLESEICRLADFLNLPTTAEQRRALAAAAEFGAMKYGASALVPGAHLQLWKKDSDFFRKARRGEWREVLSAENQAMYERASRKRYDPVMLAWLEQGRARQGDPRVL